MTSWIRVSLAALGLTVALPGMPSAGTTATVLALHVDTNISKNPCLTTLPSRCDDYVTETLSSGVHEVYLAVAKYDSAGIAGVQFGIQYENQSGMGCDVTSWRSCSDLEFQEDGWPAAGTGNLMTWVRQSNCQGDTLSYAPILVGAFELTTYSGDIFSLTPRPVDGRAMVADCASKQFDITNSDPSSLGFASFGSGDGYNPCLGPLTSVEATTWGRIKALYEN